MCVITNVLNWIDSSIETSLSVDSSSDLEEKLELTVKGRKEPSREGVKGGSEGECGSTKSSLGQLVSNENQVQKSFIFFCKVI